MPVITSQHGPGGKHHSSVAVPLLRSCLLGFLRDCYSGSPLAHWWLPSNIFLSRLFCGCCLEMNVVSESFTSNGCFSGSAILALSKYATIHTVPNLCEGSVLKPLLKVKFYVCWKVPYIYIYHTLKVLHR
jgi:hypothetical protein